MIFLRVAIIGSRQVRDLNVKEKIIKHIPNECSEIVSGGAAGVDSWAEKVAAYMNIPLKCFKPNYRQYGKNAPIERNKEIIDYSDLVLAFWNKRSRGTQWVMKECIKRGKPVKVILID